MTGKPTAGYLVKMQKNYCLHDNLKLL